MRFKPILVLALVALAATGCIKANLDIEVEDDGSSTVDYLVAINGESFADIAASLGDDFGDPSEVPAPEDLCEELRTEQAATAPPPGVTTEPYDQDGFCGVRVLGEFGPSDDPGATITQALGEDTGTGDFQIRKLEDGGWSFDAAITDEGIASETEGVPDFVVDQLFEDAEFTVEVTLPGTAVSGENNADRVDGGTFFWDMNVLAPPDRLFAQTMPGGGGGGSSAWLWILLVVLALIVIGFVAWILLRNRGGDSTPTPATAGGGPVPGPSQPGFDNVSGAAPPRQPPQPPEPEWDQTRRAWIIHDPDRGTLIHDPASDTWRPA